MRALRLLAFAALLSAAACHPEPAPIDGGSPDSGQPDAGSPDGGGSDAGSPDGGSGAPTVPGSLHVTARTGATRSVALQGSDPAGGPLTFSLTSPPYDGTASIAGAVLSYTPDAGFTGTDYLEYAAANAQGLTSDTCIVVIDVLDAAEIAPPVARGRIVVTAPGMPVAIDLTADDPVGDAVAYAITAGPASGKLTGAGAVRTYAPGAGFTGTDRFTFSASSPERGTSTEGVVWITVAVQGASRTLTAAERATAQAGISAAIDAAGGLSSSDASLAGLEAQLRALPSVALAGRTTGGLWGLFADGSAFVLVEGPPEEGASTPVPPESPSAPAAPQRPAVLGPGRSGADAIPQGRTAILINAFQSWGTRFGDSSTSAIASMLTDRGFSDPDQPGGTVDAFRIVGGHTAVHLRTHGGDGYVRPSTGAPGLNTYAVWTTSEVSAASDALYAVDLGAGRLVYMFEDDGYVLKDKTWHYGITAAFAATYWTWFPPGAYVHLSTCHGNQGSQGNAAFQGALFNAGAQLVGGWNNASKVKSSIDQTARFVFDRLLGANTSEFKLTPPQRPMGWKTVKDELDRMFAADSSTDTGASVLPSGNIARFGFTAASGGSALADRLAPSIANIATDAWNGKLQIYGVFADAGAVKVTVGGQDASVSSYTRKEIDCSLPSGASGDVVVTIDGRKSNRVRLSSYQGTFTYTLAGPGGLKAVFTLKARLVGDVHQFRDASGMDAVAHDGNLSLDTKASSISSTASGEFNDGKHDETWSGGGTLSTDPKGPPDPGTASAAGALSAKAPGKVWLSLVIASTKAFHDLVKQYDQQKGWVKETETDQVLTFPLAPPGLAADSSAPIDFPEFYLKVPATVAPDGTIQGNTIGPVSFPSDLGKETGWSYTQKVTWTTLSPDAETEIDDQMPR